MKKLLRFDFADCEKEKKLEKILINNHDIHNIENCYSNILQRFDKYAHYVYSYATKPTEDEMELYETDDELDDDFMNESLFESKKCQPMWVLPLYSLLPSKKQAKVNYISGLSRIFLFDVVFSAEQRKFNVIVLLDIILESLNTRTYDWNFTN